MDSFEFKLNQKIAVSVTQKERQENYFSRIQDITKEYIGIAMPLRKRAYVYFEENEILDVTLYANTGVYTFLTKIAKQVMTPIPLLYLFKPKKVIKSEKRKFIRAKVCLPVILHTPKRSSEVFTKDLGVSGICLTLPFKPETGEIVGLQIEIPDLTKGNFTKINVKAEILRVSKDELRDTFLAGAIFTEISDQDRMFIDDYVKKVERI